MGLKRTAAFMVGMRALEPVVEQVAERLAVATERSIEEIVERRSVSIAVDADVFRLQHPDHGEGRSLQTHGSSCDMRQPYPNSPSPQPRGDVTIRGNVR